MRRGVTLVELLVVVSILVLLAAVAIPTMRPALQNRRVREAARSVNTYLGAARLRAIATGSYYGVELTRWEQQPEGSILLRQIRVPPPYIGAMAGSVVRVQQWNNTTNTHIRVYKVLVRQGDFENYMIRPGDLIQFDVPGWRPAALTYMIMNVSAYVAPAADRPDFPVAAGGFIDFTGSGGPTWDVDGPWITSHVLTVVLANPAVRTPWPVVTSSAFDPSNWSAPVHFCILRQPVPSEAQPLQLPEQVAIDLCESGTDSATFEPINAFTPVWILFSPKGSLESVLGVYDVATGMNLVSPAERLYLSIGWRDRLPASAVYPTVVNGYAQTPARGEPLTEVLDAQGLNDADPQNTSRRLRNWRDGTSLWVTVNPISGLVTTVDNFLWDPLSGFNYNARDVATNAPTGRLIALGHARQYAARAESIGAR